jgi:hypothetical protein
MKKLYKKLALFTLLLFLPTLIFSQTPPPLGAAASFALFTSAGAMTSAAPLSQITGNVGSDSPGGTSGFGNINGSMHTNDATSSQTATDLGIAYTDLNNQIPTDTLGLVLGNGQTLLPNVYVVPGASSLIDTLILDGGGDPNACFVIQINGALTTDTASYVNLSNGTKACNVFWRVVGAVTMETNTIFKGSIIADGAFDLRVGVNLEGRALSIAGAVTVSGITVGNTCSDPTTGPITPEMDAMACFAIFTSVGTITNTLTTIGVDGHIGSNNGTASGFNPAFVVGDIHSVPDGPTAHGKASLDSLYNYINSLGSDIELLYPALFGKSQVLTPNLYIMNAAATLTDTIFLNALGNDNSIFVIRIMGALTTGASPQVVLIGGTQPENVFWQVEGAVTISSNGNFSGVIVANNGAIVLNTGVVLNGRALSRNGDITTENANISCETCATPLPIELLNFTATVMGEDVQLNWITTTEINNDYFNVERSENGLNFESIGEIAGSGNSNALINYEFYDDSPVFGTSYYRLKQTDFDGKFEYFNIIAVNFNKDEDGICTLHVYPNPCVGSCVIDLKDCPLDNNQVNVELYDAFGKKIVNRITPKSKDKDISFHLNSSNNLAPGVYIVKSTANGKSESSKIIVK